MKKAIIPLLMLLVVVGVASACTDGNASTKCYCDENMTSYENYSCYVNSSLTLNTGTYDFNGTIYLENNGKIDFSDSYMNESFKIEIAGNDTAIYNLNASDCGLGKTNQSTYHIGFDVINITINDNTNDDFTLFAPFYTDDVYIENLNIFGSNSFGVYLGPVDNFYMKNSNIIGENTGGAFQITTLDSGPGAGIYGTNMTIINSTFQDFSDGAFGALVPVARFAWIQGLTVINSTFIENDDPFSDNVVEFSGASDVLFENINITAAITTNVGVEFLDYPDPQQTPDNTTNIMFKNTTISGDILFTNKGLNLTFQENDVAVFYEDINTSEITLVEQGNLTFGVDWVAADTGSEYDEPATITFYDVNDASYLPYRDGVLCNAMYCSNIVNDGTDITFDVTGFSNYTVGPIPACDANLTQSPCYINTSLTLNTGTYNITGNITFLGGVATTLDGNGSIINFNDSMISYVNDSYNIDFTLSNITINKVAGDAPIIDFNSLRYLTLDFDDVVISGSSINDYAVVLDAAYSEYGDTNIEMNNINLTGFTNGFYLPNNHIQSWHMNDSYINVTTLFVNRLYPGSSAFPSSRNDITDMFFNRNTIEGEFRSNVGGLRDVKILNNTWYRGTSSSYTMWIDARIGSAVGGRFPYGYVYFNSEFNDDIRFDSLRDLSFNNNIVSCFVFNETYNYPIPIYVGDEMFSTFDFMLEFVHTGYDEPWSECGGGNSMGFEEGTGGTFNFDTQLSLSIGQNWISTSGVGIDSYSYRFSESEIQASTKDYLIYKNGDFFTDTYTTYGDDVYISGVGAGNYSIRTNEPPVIENFSPSNQLQEIRPGEELNLSTNVTDADNDTLTYTWKKNGTIISGENLSYYLFSNESIEVFNISVEVTDGVNTTETYWEITVYNTQPVINDFSPIENYSDYTGANIQFIVNASDDDNDTLYYSWYNDGSIIIGENATLYILQSDYSDVNQTNITMKVNDTFDMVYQEWNITLSYYPTTLFPVVNTFTTTTIRVDWTTNADNVSIYVNGVFYADSASNTKLIEGLSPSTSYTIMLVPHKDGYDGEPKSVVQVTTASDNNAPVMQEIIITPSSGFTDTVFTGSCRATDIDNANIYYDYTWYVNGVSVKSGTTGVASQGTTKSVGSLLTTNYVKGDNLTLSCIADDGLLESTALNESLIIQNSPAEVAEIFLIDVNGTDYFCDHTYVDADNDPEITPSFMWYANNLSTGNTTATVPQSQFSAGDEIFCAVETGDGIGPNATANSSTYIVGDSNPPDYLRIIDYEADVYTDNTVYISAECEDDEDNIGGGYPVLRMIDPNLNELQYSFFYSGDPSTPDRYYRYITFGTAGTYTNVNVECCDGNGNCIDEDQPDIRSTVRETIINVGGGGGSGGETEPFRDITSFNIIPQSINYAVQPGTAVIGEIEIQNTDIVPIAFTVQSIRNEETPETYRWIVFADNKRSAEFTIAATGGLRPSNRFLTYTIDIPPDTPFGTYHGSIEVTGFDQTGVFDITIVVQEQSPGLFGFLQQELFTIPSTRNLITADVIAEEVGGGTPVSVGLSLIIVGGLVGILLITRGVLARARKR